MASSPQKAAGLAKEAACASTGILGGGGEGGGGEGGVGGGR